MWCSVFVQRGLVVDTRLVAASLDPPVDAGCLYLVLEGALTTHGAVEEEFEGPSAIVFSSEQLDGARGSRALTFSAVGNPYTVIEFHLEAPDMSVQPAERPPRIALDAATWEVARVVARLSEHDDDGFRAAVERLLARLEALGLITTDALARILQPTPRTFGLLWRALRPMVETFYLTPSLKEVVEATGMSIRQVERYVRDFVASFGLVGEGWRPATRYLRLKLATIMLSAEAATIADVARTVGYRSPDAMARAFRDAGMLKPTQIQAAHRSGLTKHG
jgi:AraC-like DNA-binding protein